MLNGDIWIHLNMKVVMFMKGECIKIEKKIESEICTITEANRKKNRIIKMGN